MKHYLLLFSCLFLFRCSPAINGKMVDKMTNSGIQTAKGQLIMIPNYESSDATIFYLVRHAEKELNVENPGLTEAGIARAKNLSNILGDVAIDGIYSTNFNRTIYTAAPTAELKKIEVNSYNHRKQEDLIAELKSQRGKHFLVVGHSNSIPSLLNLFQDKKVYPAIDESIYSNFYVVVVDGKDQAKIYELKY